MSIFLQTNHLFLRNPRGGVEGVAEMKAAGFGAIFCNVRDYPVEDWGIIRDRAEQNGVACGPWGRTCDANNNWDPDFLDRLLQIADEWGQPLIVNSESELKGSGAELTRYIQDRCGDRDWALSMEPWPFANVDWTPIKVPVLPQIFGKQWGVDAEAARQQWYAYGVKCVVHTFGTYAIDGVPSMPEFYDLSTPYGLYTADDCGNNYAPWSAVGSREPCQGEPEPEPEPPPTNGGSVGNEIPPVSATDIIGTEHGITALVDWLQKQPGMPVRTDKYNAAKPGTWPWPERVERTLKILAAAHDASLPTSQAADTEAGNGETRREDDPSDSEDDAR